MNDPATDYEWSMSFLYPLIWNLYVFGISQAKTMACSYFGLYGIFWRNDRGDYMAHCLAQGTGGINPTDTFIARTIPIAP